MRLRRYAPRSGTLLICIGIVVGLLLGQVVPLVKTLRRGLGEPFTNGRIGNLLISCVPDWRVEQQKQVVIVNSLGGFGRITFGPSIKEELALTEFRDFAADKAMVREELMTDLTVYFNTTVTNATSRKIKIVGFVVCRSVYTKFSGEFTGDQENSTRVYELLNGVREVV